MSNVRLGSETKWLHARSVEKDVEKDLSVGAESVLRDDGEWGDIVDVERVYHPVEVLGLVAPDAADSKATAKFTFSVKGETGLKLKLGIATLGVSASYTVEEGLELEGTSGEATIASFLLPLDLVTQLYRPAGATEWFEHQRYEFIMLDPVAPNIGARADVVPKDQLLQRKQSPGTRVGGGSAPVSLTTSTTRELAISAEIELPLSASEKGPSLALSASVTGSVAIEVAYELPANSAYQHYWLAPIAGACFISV